MPIGRQLLLKAVNRVWTELMHSKRQMLEEIFKVSLPVNDRGHVDIGTARPALEEPAAKSWQNHLGERKHAHTVTRFNNRHTHTHTQMFNQAEELEIRNELNTSVSRECYCPHILYTVPHEDHTVLCAYIASLCFSSVLFRP